MIPAPAEAERNIKTAADGTNEQSPENTEKKG